jgi:hypothetical protein
MNKVEVGVAECNLVFKPSEEGSGFRLVRTGPKLLTRIRTEDQTLGPVQVGF